MPNIRAEIFRMVAEDLRLRAQSADRKVWQNKYEIKRLGVDQQRLKKERAELHRLYSEFTKGTVKP